MFWTYEDGTLNKEAHIDHMLMFNPNVDVDKTIAEIQSDFDTWQRALNKPKPSFFEAHGINIFLTLWFIVPMLIIFLS